MRCIVLALGVCALASLAGCGADPVVSAPDVAAAKADVADSAADTADAGADAAVVAADAPDAKAAGEEAETGGDSVAADEDSAETDADPISADEDSAETDADPISADGDSTETGGDSVAADEDSTETDADPISADGDSTETGEDSVAADEDSLETEGGPVPDADAIAQDAAAPEVSEDAADTPDMAADVCSASPADCNQLGVCSAVLATCGAGGTLCDYSAILPLETTETSCDGLDNDCDGATDLNLFTANFVGSGVTMPGAGVCLDAPLQCHGGVWGQPDSWGPAFEVTETSCDGLDNDCNGWTDDIASVPPANLHVGVCTGLWQICGGVAGWQEPDYLQIAGFSALKESACDGLDNDCDGQTDEDALCPLWQVGGSGAGKIALSPDGTQVATLTRSGAQVLDLQSGQRLLDWFGHKGPVLALAWSPDGTRLASVGGGDVLQIYAPQQLVTPAYAQAPEFALHLINAVFTAVAFAPDGQSLVVGDKAGELLVYAVPSGQVLAAAAPHKAPVRAVAWLAPGTIVSGDDDGQVLRWTIKTGDVTGLGAQAGAVTDLCPFDTRVLVTGDGLVARVLDVTTGEQQATLAGHEKPVTGCALDGQQAWTVDQAGQVRRWPLPPPAALPVTLASEQVLAAPELLPGEQVADLAVSATEIVLGLTQTGMRRSPKSAQWQAVGVRPLGSVQVLASSGGVLASAGDDAVVRLWHSGAGQFLCALDGHEAIVGALDLRVGTALGPGPLNSADPLAPGAQVASGSADFSLRLWSVQPAGAGKFGVLALASIGLGGPWPADVHYGAGGLWTAGGGTAYRISTDSSSLGKKLAAYATGFGNSIEAIVPSPDGKRVALGMSGKGATGNVNFRILDAGTLQVLVDVAWLVADRHVLAWSPDGQRIAAAGGPANLVLLDAQSGEVLQSLYGHDAAVTALAWSPNGQRLLSASSDGTARVWAVPPGLEAQQVALWTRHCPVPCLDVAVTAAAWLDDGVAATAASDGSVMAWLTP